MTTNEITSCNQCGGSEVRHTECGFVCIECGANLSEIESQNVGSQTELTAQSVERASPAKDGVEQAIDAYGIPFSDPTQRVSPPDAANVQRSVSNKECKSVEEPPDDFSLGLSRRSDSLEWCRSQNAKDEMVQPAAIDEAVLRAAYRERAVFRAAITQFRELAKAGRETSIESGTLRFCADELDRALTAAQPLASSSITPPHRSHPMTDTTPVPPVPSREATQEEIDYVEELFCDNVLGARDYANLEIENRTLLAEVERLKENQDVVDTASAMLDEENDRLRATVAEQGAALAAVVAEMDKAIDAQGEGARSTTAASVPIHMVQRWRHALGGFAALASAKQTP